MNGTDEYSWNARNLGDQIVRLTMEEFLELVQYVRKTYDISLVGNIGDPSANTPTGRPVRSFDIRIESLNSDRKIATIKLVRQFTSMGLKEAKELVESPPARLGLSLTEEDAQGIMKEFWEIGVAVRTVSNDF